MPSYLTFIAGSDIDYFYEVENFLGKGDACLTSILGTKVGGCVLNAASVCEALGSKTKVLDYLKENDEGTSLIVDTLNKNGVDTSHIKYGKDVTNGTCLIMCKGDEKCIYVIEPVRPFFNEDEELKELLFNSKYIYSLMHTLKLSFKTLNILKEAKLNGTKIIFDAGSQYLDLSDRDILLEYADGLFMNKTAYERLKKVCDFNPLEHMFNRGLEFACITDGSRGTDLYLKDKVIHEDAFKVEVKDSTGAGDSFAGAFLHFLDKGCAYEDCLKYASAEGAYACTGLGGMSGIISENELFEFMKKTSR